MFMRKMLVLVALCALLAGCDLGGDGGGSTTASNGTTTASSSSTDTGTSSTTTSSSTTTTPAGPTATPTFGVPKPTACGKSFPGGIYGYIGDMLISYPAFAGLSYLGIRLPDNMPAGQPYAETSPTGTLGTGTPGSSSTVYATSFGIPSLADHGGGFVVTICNSSTTASHILRGLGVQISGYTAATGVTLDAQVGCDVAVSATVGPAGGCGGSIGAIDTFDATWPSGAGVGTLIPLAQTGNSSAGPGGGFANLPVTLKPGETYTAFIGMNYPGQPGNYTFQFGMQVDAVPLAAVGANTPQLLLATGISEWSGNACYANATWKAIVKAHPQSWYICPA